jgi:dienelactone hydrolase
LVEAGRGEDLLPWGSHGGFSTMSAQTFLSRARTLPSIYGEGTPEPAIAQIRCPLFALYGTEEAWAGTAADLDTIRRSARSAASVQTRMIDGADHLYSGREEEVGATLAPWLDRLLSLAQLMPDTGGDNSDA